MSLNTLFGTVFQCECGRTHTVPIRGLVYSKSAINELALILDKYAPKTPACVCLFADERTYKAAGKGCEESLAAPR